MSDYNLTKQLLELSNSKEWDRAKLEWELFDVEVVEEAEQCLCGHYPIKEVCLIRNRITNEEARVGNSCVMKFNEKSNKIFISIIKIKKDYHSSVNSETLQFSFLKRWITDKDYNFYLDILRKRVLSEKQLNWKFSINEKILKNTYNRGKNSRPVLYICPYSKREVYSWAVGHAGWNSVCGCGCNTTRKEILKLLGKKYI